MSMRKNDDDFEDDLSIANTSEKEINFDDYDRPRNSSHGIESVADYNGQSEVGNKKKFTSGNAPLMIMLIIMAIGLIGYGIYYAKNMSLGTKGEVAADEETVKADDTARKSKDFNREFEQMQSMQAQDAANAQMIAASGGAGAEGQSMGQAANANPNVEPVSYNPQSYDAPNAYQNGQPVQQIQPVQQTPPTPVLTHEQERMQRLLASSFTGQSGSMSAAKTASKSDEQGGDDEAERPSQAKGGLANRMNTVSVFSATKAGKMGDRDLTLDKGSFIDCILSTRFNSQLAGMLVCETSRNIYSASGRVILLERGSKVTGQYQGDIENGQARVFVMWDRIVTPKGVGININSPAASALGESGLTGRINTHFWRNLGNAFMVSLVGSTADATGDAIGNAIGKKLDKVLGNPQQTATIDLSSGSSSSGSPSDVAMKSLDQLGKTIPTITKHQGDRITIFVARDVDFSSVYQLN